MNLADFNRYKKDEERKELEKLLESRNIKDSELEETKKKTKESLSETVKTSTRALCVLKDTEKTIKVAFDELYKQDNQIEKIKEKACEMTQKASEAYGMSVKLENKTNFFGGFASSFELVDENKNEREEKQKKESYKLKQGRLAEEYKEGDEGVLEKNIDDISIGLDNLLASGKAIEEKVRNQRRKVFDIKKQTEEATENIRKSVETIKNV